jgi:hypothetical protein
VEVAKLARGWLFIVGSGRRREPSGGGWTKGWAWLEPGQGVNVAAADVAGYEQLFRPKRPLPSSLHLEPEE